MQGLALEDVSHRYDEAWVLEGLDLIVEAGETVCLLGPSGCGKSTVLRLAAGLEHLQRGRVRIGERTVAEGGAANQVPPERRGVGLMFQDYALFPHLTVRENVGFGIGRGERDRDRRVLDALREVRLEHLAERYPHTLSGGQQQRIALVRALAPRPGVMLLDEPFSGLDEQERHRLRMETLRMLRGTDASTLMVTHDPEEAMYLADRIVVLNQGRIVQAAPPAEIYAQPCEAFVARLFGSVNEFAGTVSEGHVATPLGPIDAAGFEEGEPVEVLVRATDVEILAGWTDPGLSVAARVRSARPLGLTSELLLETGPDAAGGEIQARVVGLSLPEPGTEIRVAVRAGRAFVYPRGRH